MGSVFKQSKCNSSITFFLYMTKNKTYFNFFFLLHEYLILTFDKIYINEHFQRIDVHAGVQLHPQQVLLD